MFKFFRKIRLNLLSKNRIGKYLLYAIGEIILVIIGILIALNLNKQSEQKQAEAKIDAIFENVLNDLETDINNSETYIKFYKQKDSLLSLVLNTNLTYEDYADENSNAIWRVALTNAGFFNFTDYSYRALMDNIDAIPEKYSESVSLLNDLYSTRKQSVERYNVKFQNHVEESNDILATKSWYTHSNWKKNKEAIEYRLNDFLYMNRVKKYYGIAVRNHRTVIVHYRYYAIECYKKIAAILDKPIDSLDFILDKSILKSYVGTYVSNVNPESKAELSFNIELGGMLVLKREKLDDDILLNISSKTNFTTNNPRGGVFTFNKNNLENEMTMIMHEGHIPVTYTKID